MLLQELYTKAEVEQLEHDWRFWGRPSQHPPEGNYTTWLIIAGRGYGKTRASAEYVRTRWKQGAARIHLVGATAADVRDVMIEGPSGLLAIHAPDERPIYTPSKRRIEWPNGAVALCFSAEEPERLRGPECDTFWGDEVATWKTSTVARESGETAAERAWSNLMFGTRLRTGRLKPQGVASTTPKPKKWLRTLMEQPSTVITRGSTYENRANLAESFFSDVISRYEGTRIGRQELEAEMLLDVPGALWTLEQIERDRIATMPLMRRIVLAIDPAVTDTPESDETGIIIAGLGMDGDGYLIADHSGRYTPATWARLVTRLYDEHEVDRIVVETNQGGDLVVANLRSVRDSLPIRRIHAKRGKRSRAEPAAALCEQGRIHHVMDKSNGRAAGFASLEDQLTTWDATSDDESPDRLDAYVYAFSELMLGVTDSVGYAAPGIVDLRG